MTITVIGNNHCQLLEPCRREVPNQLRLLAIHLQPEPPHA